jgi:hypothetical protein
VQENFQLGTDDGDSNVSRRHKKTIFHQSATCAAPFATLYAYLKDVMDHLSTQPTHRITERLPHRWQPQALLT